MLGINSIAKSFSYLSNFAVSFGSGLTYDADLIQCVVEVPLHRLRVEDLSDFLQGIIGERGRLPRPLKNRL